MREHYIGSDIRQGGKVEKFGDKAFRVETPEGRFRMIYGTHTSSTDTKLLANTKGTALEGVTDLSDPQKAYVEFNLNSVYPQLKNVIEHSAAEGKPLYLVDTTEWRRIVAAIAPVLLGGAYLGSEVLRAKIKKEKPSPTRRTFIKTVMGATAALTAGTIASGTGGLLHNRGYEKAGHALTNAAEKIDPIATEKIIRLRNLIMAQKLTGAYRAFQQELSGSDLPLVMGEAHINIENELMKTSDQRIAEIKEILGNPEAKVIRDLLKTARLDFNQESKQWDITLFDEPRFADKNDSFGDPEELKF